MKSGWLNSTRCMLHDRPQAASNIASLILMTTLSQFTKKENEPITMFYQIAQVDIEEDGWTWFFRIVGVSTLTETMMSDLKSIITQVVEISDPNNK